MLFTSTVIASASGSAGGLVASRNRYGMYFRARAVPVNPNTTFQQDVRAQLAAFATRWATLTDSERSSWNTYATNTPVTNALGQSVTLTGFLHYVRSNTARVQGGLDIIDDAPAEFGLPTFTPVTLQVAAPAETPTISIVFDNVDDWANETQGALLLAASRPYSATKSFFKGPFRFMDVILGDDATPPTSPAQFTNVPFPFEADQKISVKVRACLADGRLSSEQIVTAVVA